VCACDVLRLGESQSRVNGHVLPFVKFLQDQSVLALYSRLFAGLPVHSPAVPFPLVVADKSPRGSDRDAKLSGSSALPSPLALRFHPYMHDTFTRRNLHAPANHR